MQFVFKYDVIRCAICAEFIWCANFQHLLCDWLDIASISLWWSCKIKMFGELWLNGQSNLTILTLFYLYLYISQPVPNWTQPELKDKANFDGIQAAAFFLGPPQSTIPIGSAIKHLQFWKQKLKRHWLHGLRLWNWKHKQCWNWFHSIHATQLTICEGSASWFWVRFATLFLKKSYT